MTFCYPPEKRFNHRIRYSDDRGEKGLILRAMNPTTGVLREAWTHYKEHASHLLPIAFIVYVVVALLSAILTSTVGLLGGLIAGIISIIGLFWVQGALVKAVEDIRDGRADLSLGETFDAVKPRLASITGAGLLAGLGIGLGLILLIVPGLILATLWVLIIPVIVLEGRSAMESFGRSTELVRGHGFQVFGVIVLTILILIGVGIVLGLLLAFFPTGVRSFLADVISGTLTAPFIVLVWTLLYYRLQGARGTTEGAGGPGSPLPPAT